MVTKQKYCHIYGKKLSLLFSCVWSQLNIELCVDVRSYFGGGRQKSEPVTAQRRLGVEMSLCLFKGQENRWPRFLRHGSDLSWWHLYQSRGRLRSLPHCSSHLSLVLATRGWGLSIYSQMSVCTSCQLSADTKQYINSLKMWWEQVLRRNLLKEEIDSGERFECFRQGCKATEEKMKK